MIFFADENFMERGVRLLEAFEQVHEVRHLLNYFPRGTPDTEWMAQIAGWDERPTILGGDGRILRNKVEAAVIAECDLMFVYLAPGWTNIKWHDFAWKIIKVWPAIVRNVESASRPTVFEVAVGDGKIRRVGLTREMGRA